MLCRAILSVFTVLLFPTTISLACTRIYPSYNRKVQNCTAPVFSSIINNGNPDVIISPCNANGMTITADSNWLPHIKATVVNGQLQIGTQDNYCFTCIGSHSTCGVTVTVGTPANRLQSITTTGSGGVTLTEAFSPTSTFSTSQTGSADIYIPNLQGSAGKRINHNTAGCILSHFSNIFSTWGPVDGQH